MPCSKQITCIRRASNYQVNCGASLSLYVKNEFKKFHLGRGETMQLRGPKATHTHNLQTFLPSLFGLVTSGASLLWAFPWPHTFTPKE